MEEVKVACVLVENIDDKIYHSVIVYCQHTHFLESHWTYLNQIVDCIVYLGKLVDLGGTFKVLEIWRYLLISFQKWSHSET